MHFHVRGLMGVLGLVLTFCVIMAGAAAAAESFTYEPASSIDGSLRLVLEVAPQSASPGEVVDVALTGTAVKHDWTSVSLTIDLPAELERVSGELTWSGPLKRSEVMTVRAKVRLKEAKLARVRGAGSCNRTSNGGGSVSWSGSAFFVLDRQLQDAPRIEAKPERDPGVQKVLAKRRFTHAELVAQQAKGPLALQFDVPDEIVVSFLKVTYWEEFKRPEVRAIFKSTFKGKTIEAALQTDDGAFPASLVEEHGEDGSFYSRGLRISAFGWNPDLYDIEWVEFEVFEHREAPSRIDYKQ